MNFQRNQTHKAYKITLGRYEDKRLCNSDPGVRVKLRNADSTGAFSFCLSAKVSRTTRAMRRTSRAYAPVSMRDAISFKSGKHTHHTDFQKTKPKIQSWTQKSQYISNPIKTQITNFRKLTRVITIQQQQSLSNLKHILTPISKITPKIQNLTQFPIYEQNNPNPDNQYKRKTIQIWQQWFKFTAISFKSETRS